MSLRAKRSTLCLLEQRLLRRLPLLLKNKISAPDQPPEASRHSGRALRLDLSHFLSLACAICALWSFAETRAFGAEDGSPYIVEDRRSGYTYLSPENQRLQNDDFANPGQLWVEKGRELWQEEPEGSTQASCMSCHGDATKSMRGVRTRYPRFDARSKKLINLELQINRCREERQYAAPYPYESEELLALTTFIGFQSRGLPADVRVDGPAQPFFAAGRAFFTRRRGQLDLACMHCHEQYAGQRLRGEVISQGQINGFPIYRHTWQTLGSTHRMFTWCNAAIRAQPFALGADEYVNLELYLAWRGRGLPVETPAVRR